MEQSISKKSWCRFALLLLIIMSLKAHLSTASNTLYPALEISEDGNLMLKYEGVSFFETGNYESRIPNSTIGVLLDNGNFILTSKFHNNIVFWQSFDQLTNTWLPGAKIVYDRHYNESRTTLRSWTSLDNPEWGCYSADLEVEKNTTHLVLYYWRNSEKYGGKYLQHEQYGEKLTPKELNNQYINLSYVSNRNESYFIYSAVSPSTFPRFVLNVTGEFNLYVWDEDLRQWDMVWMAIPQPCEILGVCGDFGICNQQKVPLCDCPNGFKPVDPTDWDLYDYSGGCERRDPLQCSDGGNDTFLPIPNLRLPKASRYPAVKDVEDCKLNCLNDCHCSAYVYYNRCGIYRGELMNLQQLSSDNKSGGDLHIRISAGTRVAIAMSKGEDLLTLLDHKLEGSANMEELTRACTVACWCIQDDPRDRPTMGQVVKIVEGVMHVGIPQIPLYFQRLSENPTEAIVFHETATSLSSY
ncbi:putative s-receptor kinase [Fagus crenata]